MHIFELATSRVFLKDFLKMIGILVTNSFTALLEAPEIKIPRDSESRSPRNQC